MQQLLCVFIFIEQLIRDLNFCLINHRNFKFYKSIAEILKWDPNKWEIINLLFFDTCFKEWPFFFISGHENANWLCNMKKKNVYWYLLSIICKNNHSSNLTKLNIFIILKKYILKIKGYCLTYPLLNSWKFLYQILSKDNETITILILKKMVMEDFFNVT